ncbi:hypothetical protein [Kribbella hippodromi]
MTEHSRAGLWLESGRAGPGSGLLAERPDSFMRSARVAKPVAAATPSTSRGAIATLLPADLRPYPRPVSAPAAGELRIGRWQERSGQHGAISPDADHFSPAPTARIPNGTTLMLPPELCEPYPGREAQGVSDIDFLMIEAA